MTKLRPPSIPVHAAAAPKSHQARPRHAHTRKREAGELFHDDSVRRSKVHQILRATPTTWLLPRKERTASKSTDRVRVSEPSPRQPPGSKAARAESSAARLRGVLSLLALVGGRRVVVATVGGGRGLILGIVFTLGRPQGKVVSQQLHDESRVLV